MRLIAKGSCKKVLEDVYAWSEAGCAWWVGS